MRFRRLLFGLPIIVSLLSCDCYVSVKGRVFSNRSRRAIEGAEIEMVGRNVRVNSDKNGFFHIEEQTGFCYDPHIRIIAEEYKPFEITLKRSDGIRIFELKSESEFMEYAKPFYPDSNNKSTFTTGTWIEKFSEHFAYQGDSVLFYLDSFNEGK